MNRPECRQTSVIHSACCRGEANHLQQFFPSLRVGNHAFPGLGHGVSMPADSSLLKAFSVSKRAVVRVFSRAWRLAHTVSLPSVEGE